MNMWCAIAFIAGILVGVSGIICFTCFAVSSMAEAEEEMLRDYRGTDIGEND